MLESCFNRIGETVSGWWTGIGLPRHQHARSTERAGTTPIPRSSCPKSALCGAPRRLTLPRSLRRSPRRAIAPI